MNLLRKIHSAVWMIDPGTLRAATPFVFALIRGENPQWEQSNRDMRPFALWQSGQVRYYNYNDAPPGSVAVHTVIGTVVKYGGFCSMGTEDLMRQMADADAHKNIDAHLLEMDSGGGEGTNIETVARFIRNEIKKPVITWFNGISASAAYYIAVASDEIYASEETDMAGSIGTLITFADWKEFYESQGIKLHEIYADQSDLKNQDILQAIDGNYDLIKKSLLNPYAQKFIDTVKEFRPNLSAEAAFRGQIFMAEEAISIGMIDGIKTFAEAVNRAKELAAQRNLSNQNSLQMNYPRLQALVGPFEVHDGGVFLRTDSLQMIERNLVTEGHEAVETSALDAIQASITSMNEKMGTIQAAVLQNAAAIEGNSQQIKVLGDSAGDVPTGSAVTSDTPENIDTGVKVDALAQLAASAKNGERVDTLK